MGNCSQKESVSNHQSNKIRIILASNGRNFDIEGPKLAREVLRNHPPGFAIFRQNGLSLPLFGHEQLQNGRIYYLMPVKSGEASTRPKRGRESRHQNHSSAAAAVGYSGSGGGFETGKNGVWRVKMAITAEDLEEMFTTGQFDAEKLIQRMRRGGEQQGNNGKVLKRRYTS